ncbi:unnamed protein product [Rotaria magnacalcarata]|uniref:B box-type domain-containing protein n=1 Tax=Rotaria magnacalcarata TaxID=392030 RepID=A0A816WC82_9BILA|nr:unnamed protein product [Rotaria magnacalcarata]
MAAAIVKKPCVLCCKGGGVTTCDGCQQTFCIKHIIEHRQELALQLENIGQEHDLFRRDLTHEDLAHSFFVHIDEWEQESITKIQVAAEAARADLRQLINQTRNELKASIDKVTIEMQSCREIDDYTEIDLLRWTEKLKELRKLFETQLDFQIINDDDVSTSISMIKVRQEQSSGAVLTHSRQIIENNVIHQEALGLNHERFNNFQGKVILSGNGLLATCSGTYWDGSNVYGTRLYESGMHRIHFRIENKGTNNLFFGIRTASHDLPVQTLTSPYVYGWWELEQAIESIGGYRIHSDRTIRTGDEITMILDCDNRQIQFQHHRINMNLQLPVELERCSFPWKIIVTLRSAGDSVRIIL